MSQAAIEHATAGSVAGLHQHMAAAQAGDAVTVFNSLSWQRRVLAPLPANATAATDAPTVAAGPAPANPGSAPSAAIAPTPQASITQTLPEPPVTAPPPTLRPAAPAAGTVTQISAASGERVDGNPVLTLSVVEPIQVRFFLEEADLAQVSEGDRLEMGEGALGGMLGEGMRRTVHAIDRLPQRMGSGIA